MLYLPVMTKESNIRLRCPYSCCIKYNTAKKAGKDITFRIFHLQKAGDPVLL